MYIVLNAMRLHALTCEAVQCFDVELSEEHSSAGKNDTSGFVGAKVGACECSPGKVHPAEKRRRQLQWMPSMQCNAMDPHKLSDAKAATS